jgi:hypothetical protein
MANSERSVFVMHTDGAWRVIRDGDRRPGVVVQSREEALKHARAIARSQGVSVIELNSSGKAASKSSSASPGGRAPKTQGVAKLQTR